MEYLWIVLIVILGLIPFGVPLINAHFSKKNSNENENSKKGDTSFASNDNNKNSYPTKKIKDFELDQELVDFYGKYRFHEFINISYLCNAKNDYRLTIRFFESFLIERGLKFKITNITKMECIFAIEDLTYLYIAVFADGSLPLAVVEESASNISTIVCELTYNAFFSNHDIKNKASPTFFIYEPFLSFSRYTKIKQNVFERVSNICKDVDIAKINNEWSGIPVSCIVFEIKQENEYGYAIVLTENIEDSISIGRRKFKDIPLYEKNKKTNT